MGEGVPGILQQGDYPKEDMLGFFECQEANRGKGNSIHLSTNPGEAVPNPESVKPSIICC